MQQHQSVAYHVDGDLSQQVVFHRDGGGQFTGIDGFTGGPGHCVCRTTCNVGDLLICEKKVIWDMIKGNESDVANIVIG